MKKKLTENGAKSYQRKDKEDRSLIYRDFRRQCGGLRLSTDGRKRATPYTSDVDQIEYVFKDNEVIPVALFEITRYDFDEKTLEPHSWNKYRCSILDRYFKRDAQGKFITAIAKKLECKAYIILFRNDLKSFWVFDLFGNGSWQNMNKENYEDFLCKLKEDYADLKIDKSNENGKQK